jgi:hypothetical protein
MTPEKSRDISFAHAQMIARSEPNRVLVSFDGTAVPMKRALELNVVTDYIFVRKDGWSLGCPGHLERQAHNLWRGDWILVYQVVSDLDLAYPLYLARSDERG